MVYLERRTLKDENDRVLEAQCMNLSPDRWGEIYAAAPELPQFPGGEPEAPVTDRDELNDWYESVHAPRTVNGGGALVDPFLAGAM